VSVICEQPVGTKDGSNLAFQTTQDYKSGSIVLNINGLAQVSYVIEVGGKDFTIPVGEAPLSTDELFVQYQSI